MIRRLITLLFFAGVSLTIAGTGATPRLDSLYQAYATDDTALARHLVEQLRSSARRPAEELAAGIEYGDWLLDKRHDYTRAESVYSALLQRFPKDRTRPALLYRLALAQELQENYLDAARNYEKVATQFQKSEYADDALDAIERCFRKNYQERMAYVDGHPITRIELEDRISRDPTRYESFESKRQLLDTMITARLIRQSALAAGLDQRPAFRFNLNETRNRAMFQAWYEAVVNSKAQPNEKELKAAYQRDLKTRYTTPERVRAMQIRVASRAEADSLRNLLETNPAVSWDTLAKTHSLAPDKSQGGDLGFFARGVQPKPIEDAAFSLKPGQISKPFKLDDQWVIVKVVERQPKSVRKFEDVKSQIAADIRQQRVQHLYESSIEELKSRSNITIDSAAIAEGRDTLAVVDNFVIDQAQLSARLEAIPPFFRAQFESPEGKRRILDQIILEKLLARECERLKLWLENRVVDQVLTRRDALLRDAWQQEFVSARVSIDSAEALAEYQSTISDFKEPAKVHVREIVAPTKARAEQLRRWVVAGRLPQLIHGRAVLLTDLANREIIAAGIETNADSTVAALAMEPAAAQLPGRPTLSVQNKPVADLSRRSDATGPYKQPGAFGFAFADISNEDPLFLPEPIKVSDSTTLATLAGGSSIDLRDSARYGTYFRTEKPLPAAALRQLFSRSVEDPPITINVPSGILLAKVTKRDSAQKVTFADVARRFSTAGTRWSGGDWSWVARDDKSRNPRLLAAAFNQSEKAVSAVFKLSDTTWAFVLTEEKRPARTRPFDEVRPKIENKLRRQKEKELTDRLIAELRAQSRIEILMKESDFITEPPAGETEKPAPPQQN